VRVEEGRERHKGKDLANFSEADCPASSLSIHRTILENLPKGEEMRRAVESGQGAQTLLIAATDQAGERRLHWEER
jgi:hypothetical protein